MKQNEINVIYLFIMIIESLCWANLIYLFMSNIHILLMNPTGSIILQKVTLSIGAGIYEEFLFRVILILLLFNQTLFAMEKKPYHHLPDGTFRNPEGSPKRDNNVKWSYKKDKDYLKMEKRLLSYINKDWNV